MYVTKNVRDYFANVRDYSKNVRNYESLQLRTFFGKNVSNYVFQSQSFLRKKNDVLRTF